MKREFYVKTPMGDLHIYAKYENGDLMADYPGVYVDLIREGKEPEMLTCVEYDSGDGTMLTTAYDAGYEEPAFSHHHDLTALSEEDDDVGKWYVVKAPYKGHERSLLHIMEHIRNGGSYAERVENVRYPYDHKVLYRTVNGNIGWSNFGSSANRMTLRDLNWVLRVIFEMTPTEFLSRYKELPAE